MRRLATASLSLLLTAVAVAGDGSTTAPTTTTIHEQLERWTQAQQAVIDAVKRGDLDAALAATQDVWESQPDAFGPRGRSAAPGKFQVLLRFNELDRALAMGNDLVAWSGDYPSYAREQAKVVRDVLGDRGGPLATRLERLADANDRAATQPAASRATTRG